MDIEKLVEESLWSMLARWIVAIILVVFVYWWFFLKDHCVWVGNYLIGDC